MKRMLFNATQAEELRVAIVDGQNLLDLDIETLGKEQRKGNIYKGVITRIEPSLEACFVDYGTDRHGFLPFKEVSRSYFQDYEGGRARIQEVLKEGMQVIVQVEKDERGNKGAALTTFISLAGRYLVLMPNNPRGGGVSRRIEGEDRQELKDAMAELDVPAGMSLIARTAGIGRSVEELQWDFDYLLKLWRAIEEAGEAHREPYLLFMESSLLIRAIRDYFRPDIGEILVDNEEVHAEISEFMSYVMPNNVGRLKLYQDHTPLFSRFQIEHQIESAFSRSVSLPSGGAIVIDHTEALVSIDVNSARATRGADIEDTAFKTNMEAAEEVARQMRLRDLGGLVVIDFIDMENPKHQRDVENVLRDALKKDRARVQMGKLSRFGLLELSRQRLKPALGESSHVACPRCAGTGVIRGIESTALHVLRIIQEEAMKDNTGEVHAQVPVDVATFLLNEKRAELFAMEERLDVNVVLIPNIHLENPHYEINRIRSDDVEEDGAPSYKRVAEPEADDNAKPFGNERVKAARPEPAVKGVKHNQPAPVVAERPAGWWDKFKAWFKGLFGSGTMEQPQEESRKQSSGNSRHSPSRRRGNRRGAGRSAGGEMRNNASRSDAADAEETKTDSRRSNGRRGADSRNADGCNGNRRRNDPTAAAPMAEQAEKRAPAEETVVAVPVAALPEVQTEKRESRDNRRRERNPKRNEAAEAAAVETVAAAAAEQPAVAEPAEKKRGGRNQERCGRNPRDRNGNRRSDKKRNIPSAAKIEQYLMIDEAADKVLAAVAHVFGETRPADSQPQNGNDKPLIITLPALPQDEAEETVSIMVQPANAEADMVADNSAKVLAAVAQIMDTAETVPSAETETARPAGEAVPVGQPAEPVAVEAEPSAVQTPAVAAAAFEPSAPSGLILVQTRPEALAAAVAAVQPEQPQGKRRADLSKPVETETAAAPLEQVETRRV
ncbi:Rne/Rng family ribonuclease [Neisseria elongata]|uniref:Rne/Rng family ribonuclease n=1 Tax=Neisseria elongata TaxID=495 RepID=UPI000D389447|nr:Rne/Rng family ribonuclease [Neisseria elongata]